MFLGTGNRSVCFSETCAGGKQCITMENRFNAFTDTPRGSHWLGNDSSRRKNTGSTQFADADGDDIGSTFLRRRTREDGTHRGSYGLKYSSHPKQEFLYENKLHSYPTSARDGQVPLPLISPDLLEISKQRILALAIFLIIQCYKLYDLVLLKSNLRVSGLLYSNSRFNFITKYLLLDSMFWYFLPIFRIPRLTSKPWLVGFQIVATAATTIFLSTNHQFVILTAIVAAWRKTFTKELSVTGSTINHQKLLDLSSHFKGALTIKILPENTAMLNPWFESYCIPLESNITPLNTVNVPIKINSTEKIKFVQLEFKDLYTNEVSLKNFTENNGFTLVDMTDKIQNKEMSKQEKDANIRYINLSLDETGFYQIRKIRDSKGLDLKIYQSHVILPQCPVASITPIGSPDRCIGDSDKLSIELQGVPPLKLHYSKKINNKVYTYKDTNLQPAFFESPLQSADNDVTARRRQVFTAEHLSNLEWARNPTVNIDLDSLTTQDGEYTYEIDKLIDGLGNVADFSKMDADLKKQYDLATSFHVHSIPRASLDEVFDRNSPTKKSLIIKINNGAEEQEDLPYTAKISFVDSKGRPQESKMIELDSLVHHVNAELPGTYNLDFVSSKFCPGVVIGKSNILVTQPIPPELEIKSSPILDQCVGQVGLNFELTFTGVPPYHYLAKIYKIEDGQKKLYETKRLTSKGARNQFSYSPTSEGDYEIVFDQLSNDMFSDPIKLTPQKKYTFKTSMRVKPSARIKQKHAVTLCLGGKTMIPIEFKGEAPFTLHYDILEISSNKRTAYDIKNIKDHEYKIETPNFEVGGDYILSLVSVKDSSKCVVGLSEPDAMIKVRRDIPSASLNLMDNTSAAKMKQGSFLEIPIRLSGEAPFIVKYEHLDLDGNFIAAHEEKFSFASKQILKVGKEGIYRLTGLQDSTCSGKIDNPDNEFMVSFLPKPSFEVQTSSKTSKLLSHLYAREPVCQNVEGAIALTLSGSPPFVLDYDVTEPNGQVTSKKIRVTTKYVSLQLPNREPGEYVVSIKDIFDTNYGEQDFGNLKRSTEEVSIKQTVTPTPSVTFEGKGKIYKSCSVNIEESDVLEPIMLKYSEGQGPFSITFSVYHESTSRTDQLVFDNVDVNNFPFEKLYHGLKLGNHRIEIDKVVDANGCQNHLSNENDNYIIISITDVPKIHLLDAAADYCVGDYVTYQLNGRPPFTIRYEFNGMPLKSTERTSQFVRLASEPGKITINQLEDSVSQCIVDFTKPNMQDELEKLSLVIHPIPSVTVSQGNYVVEDIHEGDQAEVIFSFEGTPPFSLTYVRTEESDGKRGDKKPQIVETHKVADIYAYEYRVVTSLQGTYEAIEISDAHCFAKNEAFFKS
ncbi:Pom152p KNAG_0E02200 [Huiozyma naganishii CBS 8797]|uniref:Nucleoporin POM152 n=1 Tax=Huiozyma naganishii (strain ATCC MYA-139 / BCRC 22969 / CBS 8797 / KCTC 17520 / NBRC 10181 / NCYC 3082 / Yp74L-3) TaxID=1071383 RepID=J7S7T6_HUIN7|nr:hypothetical protein KNAG_0E02200 [Kazachstania naganishii CBS 8797]CCK70481.1 hypothetical protein KNAG_0E02200 [Kazachstania naganishii CBS 8797]